MTRASNPRRRFRHRGDRSQFLEIQTRGALFLAMTASLTKRPSPTCVPIVYPSRGGGFLTTNDVTLTRKRSVVV